MADLPATVWRPYLGNAELSSTTPSTLVTLSGDTLITLSGDILITLDGTESLLPATVWVESNGS